MKKQPTNECAACNFAAASGGLQIMQHKNAEADWPKCEGQGSKNGGCCGLLNSIIK